MQSNEILKADLLDIVFDGRNKAYGAYELRKSYNSRMAVALAGMVTIALIFWAGKIMAENNITARSSIPVIELNIDPYKPDVEKPAPPVAPPARPVTQQVKTLIYTQPLLVANTETVEPMPEMEAMETAKIGLMNLDGKDSDEYIEPPVEKSSLSSTGIKKEDKDFEKDFTKVEKEAMFPGGAVGWKKYLERNLNVNVAIDAGAPAGNHTVKVQFIVDANGNISMVKAIEVPSVCPGCAAEAVRVIAKGPAWVPAIQNGRSVAYQAVQFITFQVVE